MSERRYTITVEVDADDNIEGGTLSCLLGIVSQALEDGDLKPVSLHASEAPRDD